MAKLRNKHDPPQKRYKDIYSHVSPSGLRRTALQQPPDQQHGLVRLLVTYMLYRLAVMLCLLHR